MELISMGEETWTKGQKRMCSRVKHEALGNNIYTGHEVSTSR